MKKSHIEERTVEKEVIDDILCNQCGETLRCPYTPKEFPNYFGLVEACVSGGYAAKLGDGDYYEFSICEDCLKVMFKSFKIPVRHTVAGWNATTPEGDYDEEGNLIPVRPGTYEWGS